jgi:hypothetical protein
LTVLGFAKARRLTALDERALRLRLRAGVGLALELATALDKNGRANVGELQMAEALLSPRKVVPVHIPGALLGQLFGNIPVDRLGDSPSASLGTPEVSRLLAEISSTGSFATCRTAAAEDHASRAEPALSNLTILTNLIYCETGVGDSRGNYRSFPSH